MKILQTVQANYAILGISPEHSIRPISLNKKVLMAFLISCISITSCIVYFVHVANNFREYIQCITTISAIVIFTICFGAVAFQMTELFDNIDCMENVIEIRE